MTQAKNGNSVTVNYTGRLEDGSVFDKTEQREPLQFVLGKDRLIKGFEKAIEGMSPGDAKTVKLAPEEAYGPKREKMIMRIGRNQAPENFEPQIGQRVELKRQEGTPLGATVTEITESDFIVDANHPLAGQSLTFDIALLEVF